MRSLSLLFILSLIAASSAFAQSGYPETEHFFIVPGTMSHRVDGSTGTALADPDTLLRRTYYGKDSNGGMTNWNSSQFKDFTFFRHPTNPSYITQPSDIDTILANSNKFMLNYRIGYPVAMVDSTDNSTLYPMIIMMHGKGERADCWNNNCYGPTNPRMWNNDHNLLHGGRQHRDAINAAPFLDPEETIPNPRHFPGFVMFPQNKNGWNAGAKTYTDRLIVLVEEIMKYYPIDPNRIYIHGLSNGAEAAWMCINARPDLFAAAAPMSGFRNNTAYDNNDIVDMDKTMIHIPVWQFQGGRDGNPEPQNTEQKLNNLINLGGTPRYSLYPNLGHGTWNTAYAEDDFFSWMLEQSKLTIHGYYGVTEVCDGDVVAVRLGISPGFDEYEWEKDVSGVKTTMAPADPMYPNEIIADDLGSYRVRFRRGTEWTVWSDPYVITGKPRPNSSITASGSTVLPSLDGSTDVTLTSEAGALFYTWKKDGANFLLDSTANEITVDQPGVYTLIIKDASLCETFESNPINVSVEPFSGVVPTQPTNLIAIANTSSSINLFWNDNSDNETGFEVYRATNPGGPYTFVGVAPENSIQSQDSLITPNTTYYYQIRSINTNGGSDYSNIASATTFLDNTAPTAPQGLVVSDSTINDITIHWIGSTDDSGIDHYYVYFNGDSVMVDHPDTTTVLNNLPGNTYYSITVKAVDLAGNFSEPSNQITSGTFVCGLNYEHSTAAHDLLPDFNSFEPEFTGVVDNFTLAPRTQEDFFNFKFDGFIYVPTDGTYTFYTTSDDGSALYVNPDDNTSPYDPDLNNAVVDNDGLHGSRERSGTIDLTAGGHPISVTYFERTGGSSLSVRYAGPGISKRLIPDEALKSALITPLTPPAAPTGLTAVADVNDFEIDLNWTYDTSVDIVVLGSSTANGTGATAGNSWVELFDTWLGSHTSSYSLTNLAKGGFTTYDVRADGSNNGSFDPPDTDRNITEALSLNPDIIIVNLPSNNAAENILIETTMSHYQELKTAADANNVKIFFTTSQPRNFEGAPNKRDTLEAEAIEVRNAFTSHVIDIYDELTDFTDDKRIKLEYKYALDDIHLNDAGHNYIFTEVVNTVGAHLLSAQVYRSETSGGPYEVVHTTDVGGTTFTDTGLAADQMYYYVVKAVNFDGESGNSNEANDQTPVDSDPPTTPGNLIMVSKTHESVALSWDSSTDNVGVSGYIVYENGQQVGSTGSRTLSNKRTLANTPSTGVTITGLAPSTNYSFTVVAKDASDNMSPESLPINVTTNAGPLPVEFLDFYAKKKENGIELSWSTASEINNAFFTVERSENLADFTSIGSIDGAGNSNRILYYNFMDRNPLPVAYYRIKQTDFDGQFDYSKVIVVETNSEEDIIVYPNPTTSSEVNVRGSVNTPFPLVSVKLLNSMGQEFYNKNVSVTDLSSGIRINTSTRLVPGIYIVMVYNGDSYVKKKLIIK